MVVLPQGCTTEAFQSGIVPLGCADSRGDLFYSNLSTTWDEQGFFGINDGGIGFEANLGYALYADYGLDTLGLGYVSDGPTLKNQTILGFANASEFYL